MIPYWATVAMEACNEKYKFEKEIKMRPNVTLTAVKDVLKMEIEFYVKFPHNGMYYFTLLADYTTLILC